MIDNGVIFSVDFASESSRSSLNINKNKNKILLTWPSYNWKK